MQLASSVGLKQKGEKANITLKVQKPKRHIFETDSRGSIECKGPPKHGTDDGRM